MTSGARSVGTHAHLVKASPLVKGMEGPFFATHPIATPRPPQQWVPSAKPSQMEAARQSFVARLCAMTATPIGERFSHILC
jgi:hypothetical protein